MELEHEGCLRGFFFDELVYCKPDGPLGYSIFPKPTHKECYFCGDSYHHTVQKKAVLNTLIHKSPVIAD